MELVIFAIVLSQENKTALKYITQEPNLLTTSINKNLRCKEIVLYIKTV